MSMQPYEADGELVTTTTGPVDLYQWANAATQVHRMAQALANTSFVPVNLRGKPDEVAAQILYGRDVNLPPMVALQQINVIEGRPSMSALAMRGLAQASGVKFRLIESTQTRCVMAARAPGDAGFTEVRWDMDRAKKLGVATKRNWQNQPQAMLIARATSELCRLVAAPLFLGLSYSTEELSDGDVTVDLPADVPPPAAPTRTVRRKSAAQADVPTPAPTADAIRPMAQAEPVDASFDNGPQDDQAQDAVAVDRGDGPVTGKTRAALMAAFRLTNIEDRDTRLAYVSDLLDREVGSINDVTDGEGRRVLDQLKTDALQGNPT